MQEETSASSLNVVRAYMAAEDIFGIPALWDAINGLDFQVSNDVLNGLLIRIQGLLERATLWLLRNTRESLSIQRLKETYKPGVEIIRANMQAILTEPSQAHLADIAADLVTKNIPADIAESLSSLHYLFYGLDIIRVAANTETEVLDVAQTYFALEMDLELHWLRHKASELSADDMWQRRAKAGLGDEVDNSLRTLTQEVIQSSLDIKKLDQRLTHWRELNSDSIKHYRTTFSEIKVESELTLAMITVAIRELRNLI
jgi:glutamate dehydrogenase